MERRADQQDHRPLRPFGFRDLDRVLHRSLMARDNNLPRIIVIGSLTDLPLRRLDCHILRCGEIQPQKGRHRANTDRHSVLHGAAAYPQ